MNKASITAMKKYVITSIAIIVVAISIGGITNVHADGAIVIKGLTAGIFDGNGDFGIFTCNEVNTPSNNEIMVCHANVTPSTSGKAVHFDATDNPLYVLYQIPTTCQFGDSATTTDWKETVSSSGQAVVVCKLHQ